MREVFRELFRVTAPGGYVAFEVGEVRKKTVQARRTCLSPSALLPGFTCEGIHHQPAGFSKTSNIWGVGNNERGTNTNRIVVFSKAERCVTPDLIVFFRRHSLFDATVSCAGVRFEQKKPVLSIPSAKLYPWSPVSGGMRRSSIFYGSTVLVLFWRKPFRAGPGSVFREQNMHRKSPLFTSGAACARRTWAYVCEVRADYEHENGDLPPGTDYGAEKTPGSRKTAAVLRSYCALIRQTCRN